jgi:hypothetical protein
VNLTVPLPGLSIHISVEVVRPIPGRLLLAMVLLMALLVGIYLTTTPSTSVPTESEGQTVPSLEVCLTPYLVATQSGLVMACMPGERFTPLPGRQR